MDGNDIIPYIEPIFRFCCKRLRNRCDAEDLSSEIICHILDGLGRYNIDSLDAWVWRIAHNRYARFVREHLTHPTFLTDDESLFHLPALDYRSVDEALIEGEFEAVFRYLHTLSAAYRNLFIDHYVGEMSIHALSRKYALPETTIKWRLNVSRQKIRQRIGEETMDRIYQRINWNTTCCNGSVDTEKYLGRQIARAICEAAYETPLTVEEISLRTGIPAIYLEDELPRLLQGEAVCQVGNKFATNFIILHLADRQKIQTASAPLVKELADKWEALLHENADAVSHLGFHGCDFGMERLGYILIPYVMRRKLRDLKNQRLKLEDGPFPPRKDGGYGWFIIEETADEREHCAAYNTGCNTSSGDRDSKNETPAYLHYYWIARYFSVELYHHTGMRWLFAHGIPQGSRNGVVKADTLSDDAAANLIQDHLIVKVGQDYRLNFPCFTEEQFRRFTALFPLDDERLDAQLTAWIASVRNSFAAFVPGHLEHQINQRVTIYLAELIGYVLEELSRRGALRRPEQDEPLTDGVFYVEGTYIHP